MGGLVARALLTLKNFKVELLNVLVTQATPHVAPVMPLDQYLTGKYVPGIRAFVLDFYMLLYDWVAFHNIPVAYRHTLLLALRLNRYPPPVLKV